VQEGERMKKKNYVFLLIESDKLEKWIKVKNQLDKDEELIEFRYSKLLPKYDSVEEIDVSDEEVAERLLEPEIKTSSIDKHYR
jgi:hypothetical protein